MCVSLGSKDKKVVIKPHMAVAFNFVDGYKPGLVVNHKNCDKLCNYYENLEWVTVRENTIHAFEHGRHKTHSVRCIETGEIFPSIRKASIWAGLSPKSSSIPMLLNGKGRTAGKHPITGQRLTWESA